MTPGAQGAAAEVTAQQLKQPSMHWSVAVAKMHTCKHRLRQRGRVRDQLALTCTRHVSGHLFDDIGRAAK